MTTGETARVKSAGTGPGLRASERAASVLWDGTSALISGGTNEMRFTPPYKQVLRRKKQLQSQKQNLRGQKEKDTEQGRNKTKNQQWLNFRRDKGGSRQPGQQPDNKLRGHRWRQRSTGSETHRVGQLGLGSQDCNSRDAGGWGRRSWSSRSGWLQCTRITRQDRIDLSQNEIHKEV